VTAGRPELLAFLAPGLLHQLGNLLFSIQGNAQVLDAAGDVPRCRTAILQATERGAATLSLLRSILGDPEGLPGSADTLLAQIAELSRVAVRESRHALELRPGPPQPKVEAAPFVTLVLEGLRTLVALLPGGSRGTLVLRPVAAGADAGVWLGFEPVPGELPFPLPVDELRLRLEPIRAQLRPVPRVTTHGTGVLLAFVGCGATWVREA
jgi:hypothetical protein